MRRGKRNVNGNETETGRINANCPDLFDEVLTTGNDPVNFRDPSGLSQQGNPLNDLFGGYSGNVYGQENRALRTVSNVFSGPVQNNFNSLVGNSSFSTNLNLSNTSSFTTVPTENSIREDRQDVARSGREISLT